MKTTPTCPARRRALVALAALPPLALAAGCRARSRCAHCGMVIHPASRWLAELREPGGAVRARYDAPKCAFAGLLAAPSGVELWARGYYGQAWARGSDLVFALGSDVTGPMGADLVPVERDRRGVFEHDHRPAAVLAREAVTRATLDAL